MTQWTPGCWWVSNMWQNITPLSLGRLVRRLTHREFGKIHYPSSSLNRHRLQGCSFPTVQGLTGPLKTMNKLSKLLPFLNIYNSCQSPLYISWRSTVKKERCWHQFQSSQLQLCILRISEAQLQKMSRKSSVTARPCHIMFFCYRHRHWQSVGFHFILILIQRINNKS